MSTSRTAVTALLADQTREAIDIYLRDMFREATETSVADRTDRQGTGTVRLRSVTQLNEAFEPAVSVQCGSRCHFVRRSSAKANVKHLTNRSS